MNTMIAFKVTIESWTPHVKAEIDPRLICLAAGACALNL